MKRLLLVSALVVLCGCSITRTEMIRADGSSVTVNEKRMLMKADGKSNSAIQETDGSYLVELKSDKEGGDAEMVQAISAGVAAGLAAAAK